jgi:RNA polymerase sigma factor (sigma-70 family)
MLVMEQTMAITEQMAAARDEYIRQTVQKERKKLLQFIRKRVRSQEDAEDILQDTLYQFAATFDVLEPFEKAASWLLTVAGNKVIDWYRKRKPIAVDFSTAASSEDDSDVNFGFQQLLPPADSPENVYLRSMVWEELYTALDELPPAQRDVFVMHELEDKSFKEIAELTGDPVNTLISRKRYAVLFLRERLKELYDELITY